MKTDYTVRCTSCGKEIDDTQLPLGCDCGKPALIRAEYEKKQIETGSDSEGLYKFKDWLPVSRTLTGSGAPVTYKSEGLAKSIGLENLWITFNGWWPEKNGYMKTGTFKECEAYTVCARMPADFGDTLVVASAGNTARAFTRVCSENKIPLVVVIPENCGDAMWFEEKPDPCVKLIAAGGESDYFDAIHLSNIICNLPEFIPEGGAKNIARRDGMGTTVVSAVTTIGKIPEYYFQAVGSGTGAIAAWEANLRFLEDGRYGSNKMKLMLSQNAPFLLLKESWDFGSRDLAPLDDETAAKQINIINAKVLSNRKPPYSIIGGLYDALTDTDGEVLASTNEEALKARKLFSETEGIDITPAAGVACASLLQAVADEKVSSGSLVMLNITGGGVERYKNDNTTIMKKPDITIPKEDFSENKIKEIIYNL